MTIGKYNLSLFKSERYTSIKIEPILSKSRKFMHYNGYGTVQIDRLVGPRIKQPFVYFLWELVAGKHLKNSRLSGEVIKFLNKLKEMLVD